MKKALTLAAAALGLLASGAHAGIDVPEYDREFTGKLYPSPWNGTWHEPGAIPPMPKYIQAPPIARTSNAPPPEFDHPFKGKLYISAENDFEQMIVGCQWTVPYRDIHGCARPPFWHTPGIGTMGPNECMILLVKRDLMRQAFDYEDVIRHEQGHCNGWRHGIAVAEKPAWPRVIETPKANVAEKPSIEKKPTARPTAQTAERPARQAHMPQPPWPLAVVSTILTTPLYIVATLTGRLR